MRQPGDKGYISTSFRILRKVSQSVQTPLERGNDDDGFGISGGGVGGGKEETGKKDLLHSRGAMGATVILGGEEDVAGVGSIAKLLDGGAEGAGRAGDGEWGRELPAFERGSPKRSGDGG